MKIEELCVGDTVLHNGVEHKVYGLYSAEPNKDERFNNKPLVDLFDGGVHTVPIDEIEGKEITLNDLIALGATKNRYNATRYHIKECVYYDTVKKTFYIPYFLGLNNITHLHHVENLLKLF